MKKHRIAAVALFVCAVVLQPFQNSFAQKISAAQADMIVKAMMSDEQMTALQAIGQIRSGDLQDHKDKFEAAKNNLVALIKNMRKDYVIRMTAADTAAYFELKQAIPVLKNSIKTENNFAIKMSFQNALDRLEGRISGEKYEEVPAYTATPSYMGTPGYTATPR